MYEYNNTYVQWSEWCTDVRYFIKLTCVLELLKPLNFSARPVVHFSGPARPGP